MSCRSNSLDGHAPTARISQIRPELPARGGEIATPHQDAGTLHTKIQTCVFSPAVIDRFPSLFTRSDSAWHHFASDNSRWYNPGSRSLNTVIPSSGISSV